MGFRSLQQAMPSQRVPLSFQRGSPAVRAVSRWMCGSTYGAESKAPLASTTVRAGAGSADAGTISRMTPPSTCRLTGAGSRLPAILASRISKSIMSYASAVSSSARHPEPSNRSQLSVPFDLEREAVRTATHLRELAQVRCIDGESLRLKHPIDDPILGEGQYPGVAEGEHVAAGLHDQIGRASCRERV